MPKTLPQLLEHSARQFPQHCAYKFAKQEISYQALRDQACSLAGHLRERGVKTGDRVTILLNKGIDMMVAVYGIVFSGAAYVPIDPSAPDDRVKEIIEQCGSEIVISQSSLLTRLKDTNAQRIVTDNGIEWSEALQAKAPILPQVVADDLAYIIFTSGSTGKPKGIVHTHASACAFATMMAQRYDLTANDIITGLSPLHFDMSTFDLFVANLVGACTVLFSEAHQKMAASLTALAETESITVWYSTPFSLIQSLDFGALEKRNLSALRWVIYGGEAFPVKQLNLLMAALPNARFSNVYGPAEVNACHTFDLPMNQPWQGTDIPIGTPCRDVECKIVDEQGNTALRGELWIAADTMMQSYWQAPDLTQYSIISDKPGKRFYRTGDIVQIGEDGLYHFIGRLDRQVKIRGFRVELEEVEKALTSVTGVKQAATFVVNKGGGINEIAADVSLLSGVVLSDNDVKQAVTKKLPHYAVPGQINIRIGFPLMSSGKIDRQALINEQSNLDANDR